MAPSADIEACCMSCNLLIHVLGDDASALTDKFWNNVERVFKIRVLHQMVNKESFNTLIYVPGKVAAMYLPKWMAEYPQCIIYDEDVMRQKVMDLAGEERRKITTNNSALLTKADQYCNGDNVAQDIDKALDYCTLAAEQGSAVARIMTAKMLIAMHQYDTAMEWLRPVAQSGVLSALFELGTHMEALQSGAESRMWLKRAADNGMEKAKL